MNKITIIERVFVNTKGHSFLVEPYQIAEIIKTGLFIRPLYDVRIGQYDLVSATAYIRQAISHEQQMACKKAYLPAVNFNGEFEDGNLTNQGIVHYSNLTALDYDQVPNEETYQYILRRLHVTPCVAMTYRTPSGHGIKAIVAHDNTDPQQHGDLYEQLLKKFHVDCAVLDSTCKDLRRFHYLCYDPDIWVNQSVVPYHYEPMPPQPIQTPVANLVPSTQCVEEESTISDQSILNILKYRCKKYYPQYLHEGFRHEGIYWFGVRCGEAGADYNTALDFVWELYNSNNIIYTYGGQMSDEELTQHFRRGYNHTEYNPVIRNNYKSKNMNKFEIPVPVEYRYLSQWQDLLNILPQSGKYIVNKVRTGCGGTTLFLESNQPCILVSPRINVLLSKHEQYPNSFLFCSADTDPIPKKKEKLKSYIDACSCMTPFGPNNKTPKILVTVDSYKHVAEELNFLGILDKYIVLVDEFQCLMSDAAFKGNVELTFLHNLQGIKSVCFLSATPIPEDYLNEMDDFNDVQAYYQLVWDTSVLEPTNLLSLPYKKGENSRSICKQIIEGYRKNGCFAQKIVNNQLVQSHEACIFLNDVKSIISIIRENKLNPDDVNVLCSQSNAGITILRHMGVHIGELCTDPNHPQNRTFTFCTKATFEGVDFYSDNAYTYIFSDGILNWNKHDLIIDVPQILGRQRLATNPFRTDATLYYRTKSTTESLQEAINRIKAKEEATNRWINNFNAASDDIKKMLVEGIRNMDADKKYENNYVDVVDDILNNGYIVKPNYLMRNMEIRDWQLSSFVYSNPIYLIHTIEDACSNPSSSQPISGKDALLLQFKEQFFEQRSISKKIELYCSFLETYPDALEELLTNPHIPLFIHEVYQLIGSTRLASLQYRESNIEAELKFIKAKDQITHQCHQFFHSGQDYPLSQVKTILQSIYTSLGLTQIASASDLGLYISITQKQLTNRETGKRKLVYHIE